MFLIIDIGNTRIKLAIFDSDTLLYQSVEVKGRAVKMISKAIADYTIDAAILSNTSKVDNQLLDILKQLNFFIHLDNDTPLPIKNAYGSPISLGKDRIAAAVASAKRFDNSSVLFIDMGTCITMNYINDSKEFIGGNIHPGISMRLKAMHKYTANLPLAELYIPDEYFGNDTISALQNGAIKGAIAEINTFIKETKEKYGPINVILTGGDAYLFENYAKIKIFVAPYLVLEGLNEILKYNVNKN